jgi:two-component system invasion response regulator UvrY
MRILLTDDHDVVRRGLRSLLQAQFSDVVIVECANGRSAIAHIEKEEWDLALLDIGLPDCDGIELLRTIRRTKRHLPILVVSMHDEEHVAVSAYRAGASGYLTKDTAAEKMGDAIRTVLDGGRFVSPKMAERLAAALDRSPSGPMYNLLTERELQVLHRLALGKTVKEIAFELALSTKTVSTYRARVLKKLELRTNADLVQYTLKAEIFARP